MSLAVVRSRGLAGMVAPEVTVEVHLANGLPSFTLVGLPDTEVKEARERVRAALQNCRFEFPSRRITVNLAPAELPKESGRFDLPIALGILAASGQIDAAALARYEFAGELSLSGALRPVRGALAMAFAVSRSEAAAGRRGFVLPRASADEAALAGELPIFAAHDLLQVVGHLAAEADPQCAQRLAPHRPAPGADPTRHPDLADVKGQQAARRALEIAAAGGHSLLMVGPPGTGKSMLAQRLPGILPPMADEEALESAAVLSLAGQFAPQRWAARAFRAPHHSASAAALVGGGSVPRPGEISLAHRGVLFLDELPEFDRRVLEVLREPLECGRITISRAARQVDFPARFQLVAAMNPCPCGYLGHRARACTCTPSAIDRYQQRISGPLLDRIDMRVEVPTLTERELLDLPGGEASAVVAARVLRAHRRALGRQGRANAELGGAEIDRLCRPAGSVRELLQAAGRRLGWSARAHHRVLKVARTIADLDDADEPTAAHVAEAIQYRRSLRAD
ncbi:MAG: YifB family Mg chelatase-like AAA ATPase [Burkholderiaceae bacterium]|jgi:magnesium chelatase family protein|nr:YifB family Mg chelatase-like AAA ATPase [Burkholderiaceae bacterium]